MVESKSPRWRTIPVAELIPQNAADEDRRDFLDTAAVIHELDLVVTPDTSLAHLAGGLGARVFVGHIGGRRMAWLLNRDDSPWYPTMRIFRQSTPGDWTGVFERIARVVGELITS